MTSSDFVEVLVVGDGLVGLACARASAARGLATCLVGRRRPGMASVAAAGFLAPTVDPAKGAALAFMIAARTRYESFVAELRESTGHSVPFALDGILRLPGSEREAAAMAAAPDPMSRWLAPADVAELEPALSAPLGARFHADDGMVDNQRLLRVLDESIALGAIPRLNAEVRRVELAGSLAAVELDDGRRIRCRHLVLAGGAWQPLVGGLPRHLPVLPLRGQMMSLVGTPVSRPVFGFGGYVIPRLADRQVIVGSTSEAVGFTLGTTDAALTGFRDVAARLIPSLARADEVRSWSGLRPMTFDGLPIIGPDPDVPSILYACGHGRNGILLAPVTGDVIADLAAGAPASHDITPFSIARFPASVHSSA
ncbi:MAG: NAD(P)/FAD-dependent oxidoreductase [Gemmatimonadota bacterium]